MGFSKQGYWRGLPCPPPGDPPHTGIEPMSLISPALAGGFFTTSTTFLIVKWLSHVWLFAAPWTVACQAPPSIGFSRQEYWCGLHFLLQGDRPDPGIEPRSPALQTDSFPSEPPGKPLLMISPFWWFPINTEALLYYYNVETQEGASDTENMLP